MRACVRVCVWSQFPPSAALPNWGSERPLSVPGIPSFVTPSSSPSTRTPCFRQACPKLRLAGTGKAGPASVSTEPFYPAPPPLTSRPVRSAHSAFTLLEFTGCGSARPHSLDAVCRRTGTPLGCSPRLFLSFDRVFTVTRSPRDPNLAPLCWGLSLSVIRTLARPAISSGDFRCRLSIGPWDMILFHFLGYSSPLS